MYKSRLVWLMVWLLLPNVSFTGSSWMQPACNKPIPKGKRLLGIDLNVASDNDFDKAFQVAKNAGMEVASLSLNWEDIETAPRSYLPKSNPLSFANSYYPPRRTKLDLFLRPADTNGKHLPEDIKDRPYDDPEVIQRFNDLMDYVFSQIPDLELNFLGIGNEIDLGFGTDQEAWRQYTGFYKATREHLKAKRPEVIVGATATLYGLVGEARQPMKVINDLSDVVLVSYYPINHDFTVKNTRVIRTEIDALIEIYPGQTIYFSETGYPSSALLKSSQTKQSTFIREIFKAWDKYSSQIYYIPFVWLHDLPRSSVEQFTAYYKLSDQKFQEYLRTLGLRTHEGRDKQAFKVLIAEAKARGW